MNKNFELLNRMHELCDIITSFDPYPVKIKAPMHVVWQINELEIITCAKGPLFGEDIKINSSWDLVTTYIVELADGTEVIKACSEGGVDYVR